MDMRYRPVWCLICSLVLALSTAAQEKARFLTTDYDLFEGLLLGMRNDTVYARVVDDKGETVRKAIHTSQIKGVMLPGGDLLDLAKKNFVVQGVSIDEGATAPAAAAVAEPPPAKADTIVPLPPPPPPVAEPVVEATPPEPDAPDTAVPEPVTPAPEAPAEVAEAPKPAAIDSSAPASLEITTTPSGAMLYVDWQELEGVSPFTATGLAPGKKIVRAVKDTLAAAANVYIKPGQAEKLNLVLGHPATELEIASKPREAKVYVGGRRPKKEAEPDYLTPAIHAGVTTAQLRFHLVKDGFRDTTVDMLIVPGLTNAVSLNLEPIAPEEAKVVAKKERTEKQRRIGTYVTVPSIACLAASGVLFILAGKDQSDARKAKEFVEQSFVSSPEVEASIRENEDKVSSGNAKLGTALGILGVGGAGLAVGIVLRF